MALVEVMTELPLEITDADLCASFIDIRNAARVQAVIMRDVLIKYVSARGGLSDCEGFARLVKVVRWIDQREGRGVLRVVR